MRLIPAKPRRVGLWLPGVTTEEFRAVKQRLEPLLIKVGAGKDLTSHLSDLVNTKGVILPGASPSDRKKDIDMVLTRQGLHHFHVGLASPDNPRARSGSLVFAEVLDKEFRIVAISDHRAFQAGSPEQLRFFRICRSYMAKDIPPGQGFMSSPVMSSGHSMLVALFALKCEDTIAQLDPQLDNPAFIDKLYNEQPIVRPKNPSLMWHFDDLKFGIFDRRTNVFFCIFPFFAR
jgi:hypothetical protein